MSGLDGLFRPRSIALIGATDKSRWSLFTHLNLREFDGPVFYVNPRAETVHGQKAYASVGELPEPVDLAYVMVPTGAVLPVLRECGEHGVRGAVVLTAGFAETGAAGRSLQDELVEVARAHSMTVLGPNGNGFIHAAAGVAAYGLSIPQPLIRGPVAFVLQSGALVSGVLTAAGARNVGTSLLVSMGNEAMVSVADVIDHLVDDDATSVIALFLESVRDPERFSRAARRALAAGKPIVALKAGRSRAGARVATAHTGAVVGDDAVTGAAFHRLGVIRVRSIEDLIGTAGLLAETGPLPGRRAGFVTPSGGACEIIADRAEDEGVEVPEFAGATLAALREICPPFAAVQNPLDVTGYILVDPALMGRALDVVNQDPETDVTVLLSDLPRTEPPAGRRAMADRLAGLAERLRAAPRPVIVMSTTAADVTPFGRELAEASGFPHVMGGIEHGMTALGRAMWWSDRRREAPREDAPPKADLTQVRGDALRIVRSAGIPVVPTDLVTSGNQAVATATLMGYPVVVKVAGDIDHKSDIGGVRLGLRAPAEVRAAYEAVAALPGATGAVVQPQRAGGVELMVGVVRDPVWGLVMAVGLGGIWVEVFGDVALRLLPVGRAEIREMLGELKSAPLLQGARGRPAADLDLLVTVIERFAALAQRLGDRLESFEINPLLVDGARLEALDALVTWRG